MWGPKTTKTNPTQMLLLRFKFAENVTEKSFSTVEIFSKQIIQSIHVVLENSLNILQRQVGCYRFLELVETCIDGAMVAPLSTQWLQKIYSLVPTHLLALESAKTNFLEVS